MKINSSGALFCILTLAGGFLPYANPPAPLELKVY